MYENISKVTFPEYQGNIHINMMPFIMGDKNTLPDYLHGYLSIIEKCSKIESGKVAYLTITESAVKAGNSQRRPGIHTEGTKSSGWGDGSWGNRRNNGNWGGGEWGGGVSNPNWNNWGNAWGQGSMSKDGIYMASTDGSCKIWNCLVSSEQVNEHGGLLVAPVGLSEIMQPSSLYWLTDRTPHEALPVAQDTNRQYFRLVSEKVSVWWKQHSTPNPFGIQPTCKILYHSKF
jgi:hypothetical protein